MLDRAARDVEVACQHDDVVRLGLRRREPALRAAARPLRAARRPRSSCSAGSRPGRSGRPASAARTAWTMRRSLRPGEARHRHPDRARAPARARKRRGFSVRFDRAEQAQRRAEQDRVALARERRAEEAVVRLASAGSPSARVIGSGPTRGRAATSPSVKRPSAQAGTSCTQSTSGSSAVASRDHLVEEAPRAAVGPCCRGRGSSCGRARAYATSRARPPRRSARRSPPGTTTSSPRRSRGRAPTSSSRRRGSASATSRTPTGYRRSERFYPLSSRLFKRSRLRLPLKAVEHLGRAALAVARACRRRCTCSGSRCRRPTSTCAFARRPSSRRTTSCRDAPPSRRDLWRRLLAAVRPRRRAQRARPRDAARSSGSTRASSRIPSIRAHAVRRDDGATLLALGVIRPYKGLADAIEVTARVCRTLACSSRAIRRCRSTSCAVAERVEWRLGFLSSDGARPCALGVDRRRLSRTAPSSTSRARSCRRSERACPRSSTTSAASASRSAPTAPGASSPAGDVDALTDAVARAARRPTRRSQLRAHGAERARAELTWDASAAQHLELYRELA